MVCVKDLAQYVNEVKRDNETLREIDQYQRSIENLVSPVIGQSNIVLLLFLPHNKSNVFLLLPYFQNQPLSNYGRPKGDGEVRVASVDKRAKQDR